MTFAQLIAEARERDYMEGLISDDEYEEDDDRFEEADERYDAYMDGGM